MKKILATILALVMVFSLSVSAMADTITSVTENNTSTGTVEVTVTEGVNDKIVYSVTVAWDDTEMEYQTEGEGTWDPSTHTYTGATEEKWVDDEATVTVTNHSNAGVTATIAADESNTLTYTFDKSTFDLVTAEGTEVNAAPNDAFTITSASTPTATVTDTFTVTITAYAEPVTFTINSNEYTVAGNTTWAAFATANSDTYTQRENYIDSNEENAYRHTFVSTEDDTFVTANSVIEAGVYTLNYALLIDDTAYIVSDDMVSSSAKMSTFIDGKSEFSLSSYTSTGEAFNQPIIYTKDGVEYYLTYNTEPVVPTGYVTNYLNIGTKLGLKEVDAHYLLEIASNALFIVSNDVETWSELAEVNSRISISGDSVLYNNSIPVITSDETSVAPSDTIVKNSVYKIDL